MGHVVALLCARIEILHFSPDHLCVLHKKLGFNNKMHR